MRVNLKVPFSEKDEAKKLGAKWDVARKTWYVKNVEDLTLFVRWIDGLDPVKAKQGKPSRNKNIGPIIGRNYTPSGCDCGIPPWEVCKHSFDWAKSPDFTDAPGASV